MLRCLAVVVIVVVMNVDGVVSLKDEVIMSKCEFQLVFRWKYWL